MDKFRYLSNIASPTSLSAEVAIRFSEQEIIAVTYELDRDERGQPVGHLTFTLTSRLQDDLSHIRDSQGSSININGKNI